eukprot:1151114-Rhodomonas_salina.1
MSLLSSHSRPPDLPTHVPLSSDERPSYPPTQPCSAPRCSLSIPYALAAYLLTHSLCGVLY